MKTNKVVQKYARAIFELGSRYDRLPHLLDEFHSFVDIFYVHNPHTKLHFLNSSDRLKFVALLEESGFSKLFCSFIRVVLMNQRQDILPAVYDAIQHDYAMNQNMTKITVETAIPLNPELKQKFKTTIEKQLNKKVELLNRVNPSIIGGMILHLDGQVFDSSLLSKFNSLKKHLLENTN